MNQQPPFLGAGEVLVAEILTGTAVAPHDVVVPWGSRSTSSTCRPSEAQ